MATTVNALPPFHRDRHGEVDKRNEKIQKEVSALVAMANGLKGQVENHVDVIQVLSKKLVEVGETIQAMVDTTENLASNVKRSSVIMGLNATASLNSRIMHSSKRR